MFLDFLTPTEPELQPSNDTNATALAIAWAIVKATQHDWKDPEQIAALVQKVHMAIIK